MKAEDLFYSYGELQQKELPLHRNPGFEIVYLVEGCLHWQVEGEVERVPAGWVFFTLPWQAHGSVWPREPGNRIRFVQLKLDQVYRRPVRELAFPRELGMPESSRRALSKLLLQQQRHSWPASAWLGKCMQELVLRLERGHSGLALQGLTFSLLAALEEVLRAEPATAPSTNVSEQRILELSEAIHEAPEEDWSIEDCVQRSRLNATRMIALFKRLTGDTPMAFVLRERVRKAEALLRDTDHSVTEVAFACGFSTSQHFSRSFRKLTNLSPSEYRLGQQQERPPLILDWTPQDEQERLEAMRKDGWI